MSLKLVFVALSLVVASVSCRPLDEQDEPFDCSGMPDGYYPDAGNAKSFYSCSEGALLARIACEDGFAFDGIDSCAPVAEEENLPQAEEGDDAHPPAEGDDDAVEELEVKEASNRKVINIEITKNIFPKSILIIGKLNREQKNK